MHAIEIASGIDAVARLRLLWREAGARAGGGLGAFEQFDLVEAAARIATRSGAEPLVAVVRRKGRVETLLPLRRERRLGARIALPLVYPLAQYTNIVGKPLVPHELPPLCKQLARKGLDILLLRKVRADSGLFEALSQNAQSQNAVETALYIDLSAYPNFASYDATFSNRTQRTRRQRRQRLEAAAGPLTFDVLRGNEAMAAFDTALSWKRLWLADRGVSSPVFDSGAWEGLLRSTVTSGSAIVTALRAGDAFAAIEVGFADRKTYVSYLGAYDPKLSTYSPGQEQMRRTIAWCFEQGFARYDLLAPADDYKRQWARTNTGVAVDDYAIALSHVGRGMAEIRRHIRPLARDIYRSLSPEMRVAGGRYGMSAAAAAAAMCAGAVIAALE